MSLDALMRDQARTAVESAGQPIFGYVSRDVESVNDPMYVIVPPLQHEQGPCVWTPRGDTLPTRGMPVLMVLDKNRRPWVVAWDGPTSVDVGGDGDESTLNVLDYGALGDGIADDTAEIQAAIDTANLMGGGVVFFPKGTYKITADLVVYDNITFRGAGRDISVIKQVTSTEHCITGFEIWNFTMEGLSLEGPYAGTGRGIYFTRTYTPAVPGPYYLGLQNRLNFRDLIIKNFGRDGVYLVQPIITHFDSVEVQTCGGHGFRVEGVTEANPGAATSVTFTNCYSNTNGTGSGIPGAIASAGYLLDHMTYCVFNGTACDGANLGYYIKDSFSVTLNSPGFEVGIDSGSGDVYRGDAIRVAGCVGVTINAPYTYVVLRSGIVVTGSALRAYSKNVTITGINQFDNDPGAVSSIRFDADCSGTLIECTEMELPLDIDAAAEVLQLNGTQSGGKFIDFMPDEFSVGTGVTVLANPAGGNPFLSMDYVQIPDATDGYIGLNFRVPDDYTGGNITIRLAYTTTASGGNVAVKQNSVALIQGDSVASLYTTSAVEAIPASAAANELMETTLTSTVPTQGTLDKGRLVRLVIGFTRATDAATDTNTANFRLMNVRLNYS